jgi:hypothetical protein
MNQELAIFIGESVMILGAVLLLLGAFAGCLVMINRLVWALLSCYGGIKTFREYKKWYHLNKLQSRVQKEEILKHDFMGNDK